MVDNMDDADVAAGAGRSFDCLAFVDDFSTVIVFWLSETVATLPQRTGASAPFNGMEKSQL